MRTFVNHDCVILDVARVRIGAHCQIATRVQILTATHPIDPGSRRAGWEYGQPVTIGDYVWLMPASSCVLGPRSAMTRWSGPGPWSRVICPRAS